MAKKGLAKGLALATMVAGAIALAHALKKNKKAQAVFDSFSPSHRREYIERITYAKQATTSERRIAQAIEWIAQGKGMNWKYQ